MERELEIEKIQKNTPVTTSSWLRVMMRWRLQEADRVRTRSPCGQPFKPQRHPGPPRWDCGHSGAGFGKTGALPAVCHSWQTLQGLLGAVVCRAGPILPPHMHPKISQDISLFQSLTVLCAVFCWYCWFLTEAHSARCRILWALLKVLISHQLKDRSLNQQPSYWKTWG